MMSSLEDHEERLAALDAAADALEPPPTRDAVAEVEMWRAQNERLRSLIKRLLMSSTTPPTALHFEAEKALRGEDGHATLDK